jgi:DNA-binding transcriptional MerR regulator/quercetin dioxygenase-like cupin family protein
LYFAYSMNISVRFVKQKLGGRHLGQLSGLADKRKLLKAISPTLLSSCILVLTAANSVYENSARMHSSRTGSKKDPVYFRIGEAARMLGVSASSLRNWEQMGLITAARSQGRYRLYSREALKKLRKIKYLRTIDHVNPAGIAAILQSNYEKIREPAARRHQQESVAQTLLRLRRKHSLTLAEVEQKTGVSVSFLSSLERGYSKPSIATLQKMARLYDTNVLSFFADKDDTRRLVRMRDRKVLVPNPGVQMELLAFGKKAMEPHLFRIAPGAGSGGSYSHEGEEFIYVLQGKLEMWIDEIQHYVLQPGDSLYFDSTEAHRWRSLSDKETLLLWVNTPATF